MTEQEFQALVDQYVVGETAGPTGPTFAVYLVKGVVRTNGIGFIFCRYRSSISAGPLHDCRVTLTESKVIARVESVAAGWRAINEAVAQQDDLRVEIAELERKIAETRARMAAATRLSIEIGALAGLATTGA